MLYRAVPRPRRRLLQRMQSKCWYRRQSPVGLEIVGGLGEGNLAPKLAQPGISLRGRDQLEAGADRLSDPASGGLLSFFEKLGRNLDRNFARRSHTSSRYHTRYQYRVWPR